MENVVYYAVKKVEPRDNFIYKLSQAVKNYSIEKYGGENLDSLYAWYVLEKLTLTAFGENLPAPVFSKRNKPSASGYTFSISHTKGVVAVAVTKQDLKLGIDVERADKTVPPSVAQKFGGKFLYANKETQIFAWTERESIIKAFDLTMLSNPKIEFLGKTFKVSVNGEDYALSIYIDKESQLKGDVI